jgi:hypothetical protein
MTLERIGVKTILILFLAGIFSYFGGMIFGALAAIPMWTILIGIILVGLLVYLKGFISLDDIEFYDILVLLVLVGVIGTGITTFIPGASMFILSLGEFSVMGLGWTLFYIGLGEIIVNKFM